MNKVVIVFLVLVFSFYFSMSALAKEVPLDVEPKGLSLYESRNYSISFKLLPDVKSEHINNNLAKDPLKIPKQTCQDTKNSCN